MARSDYAIIQLHRMVIFRDVSREKLNCEKFPIRNEWDDKMGPLYSKAIGVYRGLCGAQHH